MAAAGGLGGGRDPRRRGGAVGARQGRAASDRGQCPRQHDGDPVRARVRSGSTLTVLTCTCTCFLSMGVLVPVLPQYLAGELHQGFDMVGLAVAVPSVTAILARPLAGRTVDRHGHRPATVAGAGPLPPSSPPPLAAGALPLLPLCP